MPTHSVHVSEQASSVLAPVIAQSGIPYVIGTAPVHAADNPATVNVPTICYSFEEAVEKLGYSDDWETFTLCEFMYSHFKLYGMAPVIFLNAFDPTTMKTAASETEVAVSGHKAVLDGAYIAADLVVKNGSATLTKDTDYSLYYNDGSLYVELLSTGTAYSATALNVAGYKANVTTVTSNVIAAGVEKVELCMSLFGLAPDLIVAPGYSANATVAAAMATKVASISGLFRAKALIDVPSDETAGATTYDAVFARKTALGMVDENEIVCWPMGGLGDKIFHMSTQVAGAMAATDHEFDAPYASPSNHALKIDRLCTADGGTVLLSLQQANALNAQGIVTGLAFLSSYRVWGNYTACYPDNADVKDHFIPVSRMFDWVANSIIRTFWRQLDKPMTPRFADTILDSVNIWMNGLVGSGYLLGARAVMLQAENPLTNLMQGIIKFHLYITPPSPAQELDFVLEYDASYVESAFSSIAI